MSPLLVDFELCGQTVVTHDQGHLVLSAAVALGKYAYPQRGKMANESHAKGTGSKDREARTKIEPIAENLWNEALISLLKETLWHAVCGASG